MKKTLPIVVSIITFAIAFYAVKETKKYFINQSSTENASKEVSVEMNDALKDAREKSTETKFATDILQEEVKKKIENEMKSDKSYEDKIVFAASNFYGYYSINVETRKKYCEKLNTPIDKFVMEFEDKNSKLFDIAKKILANEFAKNNVKFSEKMMNDLLDKSMEPVLNQDMQDIKIKFKLNDAESCQVFNDRAEELVKSMAYEKQNKAGFEMLSNAKQ